MISIILSKSCLVCCSRKIINDGVVCCHLTWSSGDYIPVKACHVFTSSFTAAICRRIEFLEFIAESHAFFKIRLMFTKQAIKYIMSGKKKKKKGCLLPVLTAFPCWKNEALETGDSFHKWQVFFIWINFFLLNNQTNLTRWKHVTFLFQWVVKMSSPSSSGRKRGRSSNPSTRKFLDDACAQSCWDLSQFYTDYKVFLKNVLAFCVMMTLFIRVKVKTVNS